MNTKIETLVKKTKKKNSEIQRTWKIPNKNVNKIKNTLRRK